MIDSHQDYTVLVSPSGYAAAILYRKPHGHDRITIILASRRVSTPRCGSVQSAQWRSDVTFMVCDAQGAFWSYDITQDISLKNDKIDSDIPQHWNAVTRVPKPAQLFTFKCGSSKFTSSASGSSICCWDGACIGMADPARESYEVISTRSFSLLSCLRLNASGKLIAFLSPQEGLFIMRVTTGKTLPIHIAEEDIENNLPVSPGTGNSSAFVGIEFAGSKHLAILTHHRLYLVQISDRSITTSVSLSQDSGYITPVTFTLDEAIACVLMRPVGGNSQSGGNLTRFVDLLSGKLLTTYTLPSSPEAISLRDRTLTAVWLLSASLYRVHFAYDWSVKGTTGNSGSEMVHRTDQMSPALTNHDHKQLSNLSDLLNTMPKLGIHGGRALDVDDEYEKEHELSTSCSGLFAENINWQTRVEMCEAVRNLTWPQCIRLAERCTEAVKWNANQCWCRATEWCYCLMQTRPNLCLRNTQMLQKILTPVTREAQQRCSVDILTYCDRIVGLCDMLGVESIPPDRFNDSGSSNLKGSGSSKTTPKVIHKSIASLLHDPYVLSLMKGAS